MGKGVLQMTDSFIANETFENIPDIFFSLDDRWCITYVNHKACELVGRSPQELMGKELWEEYPELCGTAVYDAYHRAREKGVVQHAEMQGPDDGTWYSILAIPMAGGIHVYGQDVTRRRQAEKALIQNEQREAFLLKFSDAIRPLADPLDIQEAAARVLGEHLRADRAFYCDVVIKDGVECFSTQRMYHTCNAPLPLGLARVDRMAKLLSECRRGQTIVINDLESDPRLNDRERASCHFMQMMAVICVPLIKNGRFMACFMVHQSHACCWTPQGISVVEETAERTWAAVERARAIEALRESQAELKAELYGAKLLQSVSLVFFNEENIQALYDKIVDAAAGIMQSQAASLQVYYPEHGNSGGLKLQACKGLGQKAADAWEWVDITAGTPCATAWRTGRRVFVQDVETCDFMMGTSTVDAFLQAGIHATQATPLYSRTGKLLGMISTHWHNMFIPNEQQLRFLDVLARLAADVIERRQAESALLDSRERMLILNRELEKADRNKNEFLSALSHELRNPLAAISVGLQLIDNAHHTGDTGLALEIMKRQMNQLCRLVDDLLDLTRIRCNKIHLKKEKVELNVLAMMTGEDIRQLFERKGINLLIRISCEPIYLYADPVRLKQIIGNLLHNAQKFTDEGGKVELSVFREDKNAVICVRDNGIGIRQEMLSIVFDPFTQADNSLDRSNGGLGLGLSIVRSIAQLHGGSAAAFSEGLGKGSSFLIRLPLIDKEENAEESPYPCNGDVCPLKILLIENSLDYADLLRSILEKEGHLCVSVQDGIQGMEKAIEFLPDAVFCDIGLPVMDGFEVARRLRSEPSLKNAFLIALTGYAEQRDVQTALEAGFHIHISKPADLAAIRNALHEAIALRVKTRS
jgi:PAS domain S-box-containing protein